MTTYSAAASPVAGGLFLRYTETEWLADGFMGGPTQCAIKAGGSIFFSTVRRSDGKTFVHKITGSVITSFELAAFSLDVHNNASVTVDSAGYVYVAYVAHGVGTVVRWRKSETPYSIDFGAEQTVTAGTAIRYPRLAFDGSGRLWLFCNSGNPRNIVYLYSDNDGSSWSSATTLWQASGSDTAYFEFSVIGNEIALITTKSHSDTMTAGTGHGYFMLWDGSSWKNAAGSAYTLPVTSATGQQCYNAATTNQNLGFWPQIAKTSSGWVAYCGVRVANALNNGVVRMSWDGSAWSQSILVTHAQGAYGDDMSISSVSTVEFFCTRVIDGVNHLYRYWSNDGGLTWGNSQLTSGAVSRQRGTVRRVHGAVERHEQVLYCNYTRNILNNTEWTSSMFALFDSAGV